MPVLVKAIKDAILAANDKATIAERGANFIRHSLGGNKHAWDGSIAPCYHYLDGGDYKEVDTDPADSDLGGYADLFAKASYKAHVDQYGGRRIYPRRGVTDEYITIGRPQRKVGTDYSDVSVGTRTRDGGTLRWDTTRFTVEILNTGCQVKLQIILKDSTAGGWLSSVRFPVSLTGLTYDKGAIKSGSTTLAVVTKGWLRDNAGTVRVFDVEISGGYLYMEPDLSGLEYPIVVDPTVDLQVGTGADDAEWIGGSIYPTDTSVAAGNLSGSTIHSFARFTSVTVSGTVTTSYLTLKAGSRGGSGTVLTRLSANDAANPSAPTTYSAADELALTTAKADWDVSTWSSGTWYNSSSLNTVIQELVDSYTYSGSQAIIVVWRDDGSSSNDYLMANSYEAGAANAPKFHIEYTAAGGGAASSYYGPRRSLLGVGR